MALRMAELTIGDMVRELSPEALRYFADMELSSDWPPHISPRICKFVRLGEVIIMGSTLEYGEADEWGATNSIFHRDLLSYGKRHMGDYISQRIEQTAPEDGQYLERVWPLVDAGYARIGVDRCNAPTELIIDGDSFNFGRPADDIRQKTGELARLILGQNIQVEVA